MEYNLLMLERDIQDYLFLYPEVLFPGQVIEEKHREYFIQGKRIDLLFKVEGTRYIVELKRDSIEREHLGQILEYYGLLRESLRAEDIRMILVAPRIPPFRRIYLQELGIRCVEITVPFEPVEAESRIAKESWSYRREESVRKGLEAHFPPGAPLTFEDLSRPVTPRALAMTHRILRDSLEAVRKGYSGYETVPVRMNQAWSADLVASRRPLNQSQPPSFEPGGAWWAYAFGPSEDMPKNDVPNISVASMPGTLDLVVNAELRTSQRVMMDRLRQCPAAFNHILQGRRDLEFQVWLKLEHQPRFYHWLPIQVFPAGSWTAEDILAYYWGLEGEFPERRKAWLAWILEQQTSLSDNQRSHLERRNRALNVALRIVRPFGPEDDLWSWPYEGQVAALSKEIVDLRPFLDYFLRGE